MQNTLSALGRHARRWGREIAAELSFRRGLAIILTLWLMYTSVDDEYWRLSDRCILAYEDHISCTQPNSNMLLRRPKDCQEAALDLTRCGFFVTPWQAVKNTWGSGSLYNFLHDAAFSLPGLIGVATASFTLTMWVVRRLQGDRDRIVFASLPHPEPRADWPPRRRPVEDLSSSVSISEILEDPKRV